MQLALFEWLEWRKRTLILPNFTPFYWYECDMFSLTRSLYFHEIEIKVSRADFRADFKKFEKHRVLSGDLTNANWYGPSYLDRSPHTFCYACPAEMLAVDDVPAYAGLIWVRRQKKGFWNGATGYLVTVEKRPPMLPAEKMKPEQVLKISNNLWYRYAKEWKERTEMILDQEEADETLRDSAGLTATVR